MLFAVTLAGCGSSSSDIGISGQQGNVGNNNPNPNPNPGTVPVTNPDTYATTLNQALTVAAAAGVSANDTTPGTVTFPANSAQGGTVTGQPDGSFTYTPAANFLGTDTFSYTATLGQNSVTENVSIAVVGNARFVNNTAAPGGNGSFTAPFNSIQAATAGSQAGDTFFVFRGNGNAYTGQVTLLDNQRLIGEGSGLGALARGEETLNQVTANFPVLSGPVVMGNGCTVAGVRVQDATGSAIVGDGRNGGTITNNQVENFATNGLAIGVSLVGVSGNWTISNNVINRSGPTSIGCNVTTGGSDLARVVVNGNTFSNSTSSGLAYTAGANSTLNTQVVNNTFSGNQLSASFEVLVGDSAVFCLDITGNTNDGNYRFASVSAASTRNVEQLSQLQQLNTGTVMVESGGNFVPFAEVADGACGF